MARRKNRRMFSREQRRQERAEQLARAETVTQEQLDAATIGACTDVRLHPELLRRADFLADVWAGLREWGPDGPGEQELMEALGRQFERVTGERITDDAAAIAIESPEEFRDAYAAAMDERYVEPSLVERVGSTDAGYEERILDAEMAAGELDDTRDGG